MKKDSRETPKDFKERDRRKLIKDFSFSWLERRLSKRFGVDEPGLFLDALVEAYKQDVFGCPKRSDFEEKFQESLNRRQLGAYSMFVPLYTKSLYEWGVIDPCGPDKNYFKLNNVWEDDLMDYIEKMA